MLDGVSAFPMVLSPFVSHCTPSCCPWLDGASAFPRVLSPFVSHCTPSCCALLDGVPALPPVLFLLFSFVGWRVLSRVLSAFVSYCTLFSLCWMVCPLSRRSCLPLSPIVPQYPFLFPFVGWCVRLLEVLSPFVSHCALACFPSLDGCVRLRAGLPTFVSHCTLSCCPKRVLLGVPNALGVCLGVGWCVRLPDGLVSLCLSLYPFLLPLVGWCVCLPESLVSLCLSLYPFLLRFVGWCARLATGVVSPFLLCWMARSLEGLVCLCLLLYPFFSLLDGVSAFPKVLSPFVSHCTPVPFLVSLCWMVRSPSWGLVSLCLPLCACSLPFVGWCVRLRAGLPTFVSHCTLSCCPKRVLLGVPNALGVCLGVGWCVALPKGFVSPCLPLYPFFFPFVGWCVRLREGFVSLCLPLYPFLLPLVGWCVCLRGSLFSFCLPLCPLLVSLCWMVCPPSRGSCLPLSLYMYLFHVCLTETSFCLVCSILALRLAVAFLFGFSISKNRVWHALFISVCLIFGLHVHATVTCIHFQTTLPVTSRPHAEQCDFDPCDLSGPQIYHWLRPSSGFCSALSLLAHCHWWLGVDYTWGSVSRWFTTSSVPGFVIGNICDQESLADPA